MILSQDQTLVIKVLTSFQFYFNSVARIVFELTHGLAIPNFQISGSLSSTFVEDKVLLIFISFKRTLFSNKNTVVFN